jgi:hypothetical protein
MEALDNIDLDDMFADDGDALFDGLDIDIDMDEITGDNGHNHEASGHSSTGYNLNSNRASSVASAPAPAERTAKRSTGPSPAAAAPTRTSKRKTKRKTRTPAFFEDSGDDYEDEPSPPPQKKKKKATTTTKAAATGSATKKKAATTKKTQPKQEKTPMTGTTKGKGKSKASANAQMSHSMTASASTLPTPPPQQIPQHPQRQQSVTLSAARGIAAPSTSVAAAGQFGGRQKQKATKKKAALPLVRNSSSTATNNNSYTAKSTSLLSFSSASTAAAGGIGASSSGGGKLKGRAASLPTSAAALANELAQARSKHLAPSFCGILPSSTLFYPFMPALPSEPNLKSRKAYAVLDKIHTSFVGQLHSTAASTTTETAAANDNTADAADKKSSSNATGGKSGGKDAKPAKQSEVIFQLVEEAFKEDRPAGEVESAVVVPSLQRSEAIGTAIGATRSAIVQLDQRKIIGDLYAVCGLMQRQYDFLKQNADNMERWCKRNLPPDEYAEVYLPPKAKPIPDAAPATNKRKRIDLQMPLLGSFASRTIKVKVLCNGYSEPKASPLVAILPMIFSPDDTAKAPTLPVAKGKKTKKQKGAPGPASSAVAPSTTTKATSVTTKSGAQAQPQVSYANMKPMRRRKNVAEMVARTARELEMTYRLKLDIRMQAIERYDRDVRKVITDDNIRVNHTVGMWKWIDAAGYFADIAEGEARQRISEIQSQDSVARAAREKGGRTTPAVVAAATHGAELMPMASSNSMFDRLQNLLFDEGGSSDDENDEDISGDDNELEEQYDPQKAAIIENLNLDERAFLILNSVGIKVADLFTPASILRATASKAAPAAAATSSKSSKPTIPAPDFHGLPIPTNIGDNGKTELDETIEKMILELSATNQTNDRRAAFLEAASQAVQTTAEEQTRKREYETRLITECHLLLRRTKELKEKEAAKKNKALALPW